MISISTKEKEALSNVKYIDLFAGIGGFRLALDSFGAKCVFTSEWDMNCQEVYKQNFLQDEIYGDITQVHEKDIPKHDILCAGFPCQAFSISGKRKGFDDSKGTLFFDIARIAKLRQPNILILENVKNLMTINGGKTFQRMIKILKELNYDTFTELVSANLFGVPQKRERIFFICFHNDLKIKNFKLSAPNFPIPKVRDILEEPSVDKDLLIRREDTIMNEENLKRDLFEGYESKIHRIGTINKGGQGERIYSIDGLGITLSAYGGGPGRKTGAYKVGKKIRRLSPRETARMMGFPDSFGFHKNIGIAHTQFGNSVVVNIVQFILRDLLSLFSNLSSPYLKCRCKQTNVIL